MSLELEGHTSRAFDGAISALHMRVVEMGALVLLQVREAANAYSDWDESLAARVLQREHDVDAYNLDVDAASTRLIALRQPMASDLRAIVSMSKAVAELERAGDEARKIAQAVVGFRGASGERPGTATCRDLRHLGKLAVGMMRCALEAFDRLDGTLAIQVIARDHELDAEYSAGLRRLMSRAMEDPRQFSSALQAAFVAKSLERIGDHARNLARRARSMSESSAANASGLSSAAGAPAASDPSNTANAPRSSVATLSPPGAAAR